MCHAVDKIITPGGRQTFTIATGQEQPLAQVLQEIKPEGKYTGRQRKVLLGTESAELKIS